MANCSDMTDLVPTLTVANDNRKPVAWALGPSFFSNKFRVFLAAGAFLATLWELGIFSRGLSGFSWFDAAVSVFVTLVVVGLEREIRAGRFTEWWRTCKPHS